ncbi:alpha-2-macroglobulin family protein [Pedobacter frigiditerrae]|uniref:alpha-2-macroglobulin family protein n=1 Tax=Pedobacter frigiditerrae TaxID=2530452 RepID=UPI0029300278|nr:MG2 domain-containing protein [Pedobacter frigiditerrae]
MENTAKYSSSTWKKVLFGALFLVSVFAIYFFFFKKKSEQDNQAYAKYIESYTSGTISKKSFIRVHLASAVKSLSDLGKPDDREIFDFSPNIKGKTFWIDPQTIEFRPDEQLEPDQKYEATINLSQITTTEKGLEEFDFDFKVIKPGLNLSQSGLVSQNNTSLTYMKLMGEINTADFEEQQSIEKSLNLDFEQKLKVKWTHDPEKHRSTFVIDSIKKINKETTLILNWNGEAINADDDKGEEKVIIPAKTIFKVLDIKAVQGAEDYALIQCSEPINVAQDLNGLISLGNLQDLRFTIDASQIKVYAPDELQGNYAVTVNSAITDIEGKTLESAKNANIIFEDKLPSVTIAGTGTILPNSGKLVLPFEAVNLKAVDVTVIKIYENNIPQFFQVNNYKEGNELRRVAKPVVQKTIRLDEDKAINLHKKTRFTLDLDKLIRTEPGAMYRVTIGFRKAYNVYECKEGTSTDANGDGDEYEGDYESYGETIDEDDEFWNSYQDYYPNHYRWADRDNPCTPSYYTNERWASRNLLASNIGLVAKRGNDNSMLIVATDLLTAKPLSGVSLELQDYQRQILTTVKTDGDGLAIFDLKRKPFLLVAKNGRERGYLKLDDGNSLPLSRFDVGGDVVQNGIKGLIYGERGVWRPGDSVFVSFILEDKLKKLPANYPVTFELTNPKGQLAKRTVIAQALNGFYTFKTATESTAPTGNWLVKAKVGGASFSKTLKIETVMPNRLKINFDLGGKTYLGNGASSATTLSAKWLFGTPAQNLKAKVDVNLNTTETKFKGFDDYSFDNPTVNFESQIKTIFEGALNAAGTAFVNTNLSETGSAPGVLRANFSTKIFEPGGNFSIDNFSIPYHVYNNYLGVKAPSGDRLSGMLLTDKDHKVEIVNVNRDGKLLGGSKTVSVELYKVQWRWWWEQDNQQSYANFTQNEYNKLVSKQYVNLTNGKGDYNLRINEPNWGRYLILVRDEYGNGHTTGKSVYIDWPGWAQREQGSNPTEASMLSFTANKKKFIVGEDITLTIPTGENGKALVSIENGSRVLKTYWVDTKKGQTQFSFKAEKNMAPNVFANITLIQPHAQTLNDLPIRMYGAIPLTIEDPETILKPVIKMAPTLKPEVESTISVSESNGKAMTYTIALVDEGLLDLTRFKTPDPHSVFYAREGLGVKTWDLFDQVLGAWGGNLERILSIGGDGSINRNLNPAKANRFKPVVKFMGPYYLGKGENKTHKFKLPQYIGSVRAMVIAGQDGAYGFAEKAVEVKKPLMVLATLPRVIGPGESFTLPVNIFATNNNLRNVLVQLQSSNLIVSGLKTQQLSFKQAGEQMTYFQVTAPNNVGVAKVKIVAQSGSEKTVYDVEMDIRNPNPYITNVVSATIQPNQTWSTKFAAIGMSGTNSGSVEVSSIPPINLNKRLSYLIQYPHGCVEQTTSSVFPQLMLDKLTPLSTQRKTEVERNIKSGINRLKGFQTTDGGLSYWPGEGLSDEWGTNYAGHFLIEAQNAGYTLPAGMFEELIRYQKSKANNWVPNSENFYGGDLSQAYRLYVLALAKKPEMAAMNRLRAFEYLSVASKWRLAAAYQLAGQAAAANGLIRGLAQTVKPYNQLSGTYGSDLRDEAMIMETLTLMGQKNQAAQLLTKVASRLGENTWYSTQTTAYGLLAIAKFCGQNSSSNRLQYNYVLNGSKGSTNSEQYLNTTALTFKNNTASITNTGKNVLFARLILQGQPVAGQNNFLPNNPEVLDMNVSYKTLKGLSLDPSTLKQGTDFYAEVTVKNPGKMGYYEQMALTQIFPSGWEIINTRLNDNEGALASAPYTYRDVRDDRVFTYFNIRENETLTYRVLLNASYLGKYYLSAVQCEAMYNNNISATQAGKWVQVVK